MPDIFLSYTEKDREQARQVATVLEAAGWSIWWDRRIPAGKTWRQVLEKALDDMRCMVVLWSARSIESEWVFEEASEGRRQGKLIPVMLESVRPPAGFREIHAADLANWDGTAEFEGMRLLLADLEQMLGKPTPKPPPPVVEETPRQQAIREDPYDDGAANDTARDDKRKTKRRTIVAVTVSLLGIAFTFGVTLMRTGSVATQPADLPESRSPQTAPRSPPGPTQIPPIYKKVEPPPVAGKDGGDNNTGTKDAAARPSSAHKVSRSAICANIQSRMELGEPITAETRAKYAKECQS